MLVVLCWVTVLGCVPAAQALVYWGAAGSIGRANADGSGVDQTFITYGGVPSSSVALDSSHIYWAQSDTGVERANLDGTGLKSNFIGTGHGNANAVAVNSSFVYWSEATGGIARANLDGTGINTSFIANVAPTCSGCSVVPTVLGVAVDGQHIYWAAFRTTMFSTVGNIGRANLDGSGADPGFITLPTNYEPIGMAVNGQRLYWSYGQIEPATQGIGSADIAGTGVNTNLVSVPGFGMGGIALDSSHIYWAEEGGGAGPSAIGRANLDGSGANLGFITGLSAGAYSVAVDQSAPTVTINGTVQTFQGANPRTRGLAGVRVALDGTDHTGAAVHLTASTDTSGSYHFTGVQEGIYTVSPTGDPPAQASPFDDPPAGGRYVTTACDGAMTAGGCQIITATAPASAVASFVYGQDHTLKVDVQPRRASWRRARAGNADGRRRCTRQFTCGRSVAVGTYRAPGNRSGGQSGQRAFPAVPHLPLGIDGGAGDLPGIKLHSREAAQRWSGWHGSGSGVRGERGRRHAQGPRAGAQ